MTRNEQDKDRARKIGFFPVCAQVILRNIKRQDIVDVSAGAVEIIGENTIETVAVELPEKPDDKGTFTSKIVPNFLNFPGMEFRMCATEKVTGDRRTAKVFCLQDGSKPRAFRIINNSGVAKITTSEQLLEIFIRDEGNSRFPTCSISGLWIKGNVLNMRTIMDRDSGVWNMVLAKFRKSATSDLVKNLVWALEGPNLASLSEAVAHTLLKVWPVNGSANAVWAIPFEHRLKSVAGSAPKPEAKAETPAPKIEEPAPEAEQTDTVPAAENVQSESAPKTDTEAPEADQRLKENLGGNGRKPGATKGKKVRIKEPVGAEN